MKMRDRRRKRKEGGCGRNGERGAGALAFGISALKSYEPLRDSWGNWNSDESEFG